MRSPLFSLLLTFLLASNTAAVELRVSAASSLTGALRELGDEYDQKYGVTIRYNFGASSALARQIEEGAPVDFFFSADEHNVDLLARRGRIIPSSRRSFLSNRLVIVVPTSDREPLPDAHGLLTKRFERIAIASNLAPAGVYAVEYLNRIGLWPRLQERVVRLENVRGALAAVETGNADAAFVYESDARSNSRVRVAFRITGPEAPSISYGCAVVSDSPRRREAVRFAAFLASEHALKTFERFGFVRK
jgi:molybdate transport system substrate-binding protein